jgi:DNA mismatch repair protein MutS2
MASPEPELDLHRLTADEALLRLNQYLYETYIAGIPSARVVHGKGTGTLQRVVRKRLMNHHLVKSFRPAKPKEGGGGVTVVEMADY